MGTLELNLATPCLQVTRISGDKLTLSVQPQSPSQAETRDNDNFRWLTQRLMEGGRGEPCFWTVEQTTAAMMTMVIF